MSEFEVSELTFESRLVNVISLLIPVRSYTLHCAWTQEMPLPAIEEFTCRLLVLLDEVLPGDIRKYFGLTNRECEILIDGLIQNRLAVYSESGHLAPSSMLRIKSQETPDAFPSLTRYEERVETPLFDLLTLSIIASRQQRRYRFGLPQLSVPDEYKKMGQQEVLEAFSKQYHTYLDLLPKSEHESWQSRLYKISSCEAGDIDQISLDVAIALEPTITGPVRILKTTEDKARMRRPLTIEMEAKISDFLNAQLIPDEGVSFEAYCSLVNDEVLLRYVQRGRFDFNAWLNARREKKTGYGTPETTAMIGPIYLEANRHAVVNFIRNQSKRWTEDAKHTALWLGSSVPLWAANGELLSEFVYRIEPLLSNLNDDAGHICALLHYELRDNKASFQARIPNGITFKGPPLEDRVEIFLIPDELAVVQYHCQPSSDSAITVPIGYMTIEPERLVVIESLLKERLLGRQMPTLSWPIKDRQINELFNVERFMNGLPLSIPRNAAQPTITFKPKKREF
ncbi:hypothetical protein [Edaphovirga cremea]|uniref:hypothetical protein n=1 Tax=Edaphovirga cremea TaxID=2267246 RepID=UPI003988ACCB